MIELATEAEHLAGANYIVIINGWRKFCAETPDEVWRIIGEQRFGSRYEVRSPAGLETREFIPF